MTTPSITSDLATIEKALKQFYFVAEDDDVALATDGMVAFRRIVTALQPSDDGVAVAGADDDETEHGSGVPTP